MSGNPSNVAGKSVTFTTINIYNFSIFNFFFFIKTS